MDCSEADQRGTAVDVVPVVVGVRDVQLSLILVGVAVGVADQRGFPLLLLVRAKSVEKGWAYVVVEVCVGNGNPLSTVADINKTVQVILSSAEITREIAVVNPHVGGLVDSNSIAVVGVDTSDLQVTHDNIANLADVEANTGNSYID